MTIRFGLLMLAIGVVVASPVFANAATEGSALRIKVVDAESHQIVLSSDQAPQECDQINYSGYCHGGRTQTTQHILTVQEVDGESYHLTCTVDTRWSRCEALVVGAMYDARMEKHGITIYYVNDGKLRKQLYTFVAPPKPKKGDPRTVAANTSPAAAALPSILEPVHASPAPLTVAQTASAQSPPPAASTQSVRETVRCSFTSTPPGAEITLDGRYFGNTPSVLGLTTGTHVVVLFAPGFAQWKKELTVASGSEVNVSAILQKTQQ
jgi:hypothetical protein